MTSADTEVAAPNRRSSRQTARTRNPRFQRFVVPLLLFERTWTKIAALDGFEVNLVTDRGLGLV
jgi:hypothetical protein